MVHSSNLVPFGLDFGFWHSLHRSRLNAPEVTNAIRSFEPFEPFERSSLAPLSENGMVHVTELELHYQTEGSWRLCMWQTLIRPPRFVSSCTNALFNTSRSHVFPCSPSSPVLATSAPPASRGGKSCELTAVFRI